MRHALTVLALAAGLLTAADAHAIDFQQTGIFLVPADGNLECDPGSLGPQSLLGKRVAAETALKYVFWQTFRDDVPEDATFKASFVTISPDGTKYKSMDQRGENGACTIVDFTPPKPGTYWFSLYVDGKADIGWLFNYIVEE